MINNQAPAFAEAASRRQANNQIIPNDQNSNCLNKKLTNNLLGVLNIGYWNLFGAWNLVIGI